MKKEKLKTKYSVSLWRLFLTFFKVGAFTFGGGYAMIAILEEELISKKHWITEQDMLDMLVIAESTPGVIAVNTATSVGYKVHGISGAILATLGVVLPSFLIIFALSFVIQAFQSNTWYKAAFTGVRACVTILIINAFTKLSKQVKWDVFGVLLLIAAFGVAVFTSFDVIYLILIGGVLGVVYSLIAEAVQNKKSSQKNCKKTDDSRKAKMADVHKNDDTYAQSCITSENFDTNLHAEQHASTSDNALQQNILQGGDSGKNNVPQLLEQEGKTQRQTTSSEGGAIVKNGKDCSVGGASEKGAKEDKQ